MTKVFSIIFSTLILIQSFNISLEDFSKLNILMEHASFHEKNYGDSFLDFLNEHYGSANIDQKTAHEEHDKLPFKHDHQTCQHSPSTFMANVIGIELKEYITVDLVKNFFYKTSDSLFEKPIVFQPPRLT
jgi:hypothetical protein